MTDPELSRMSLFERGCSMMAHVLRCRPAVLVCVVAFAAAGCSKEVPPVGTARSLLPKSAGLRSPAWVSLAVAQFPRARRRAFFRAELQSDSIVVSRRAAQLIHSESRKRERQAGVAVHGRGVSRWPTQLEFAMRGSSVPPWGLLPQDAGQCEGRGLRLRRVPLKLRSCVRLAEGGCKGRAGSPANA